MARITRQDLDAKLLAINTLNGTANQQQYRRHRNNLIPNEGAYMLTDAFGPLALVQMMEQGTIRDVFQALPKARELHDLMDAYALGMQAQQQRTKVASTWNFDALGFIDPALIELPTPQPTPEVQHA